MNESRKTSGIAVIMRSKEHAPNHAGDFRENRPKLACRGLLIRTAPHTLLFG